jgi:peptidoglycan hydrolase-like protein with peptidoglycan-binding domain
MSGVMDSWMWSDWFREATGMHIESAESESSSEDLDEFFPEVEELDSFSGLDISSSEIQAAQSWGDSKTLDSSACRALQSKMSILATGKYGDQTIAAVYAKQRELQPQGTINGAGIATRGMFDALGLIWVEHTAPAKAADATIEAIKDRFPNGITVALLADFSNPNGNDQEFERQANRFAQNQGAVGLVGGDLALGVPIPVEGLSEALSAIHSIIRALRLHDNEYEYELLPWLAPRDLMPTKIANLAIFCHGTSYGMGLNSTSNFNSKGLHNGTQSSNPSNIQGFVKGMQGTLKSNVDVQLFSCDTGRDDVDESYGDWVDHDEGQLKGSESFAAEFAASLGGGGSVFAHTTTGHTTENYAARVFGARANATPGAGGIQIFELLYPRSFIEEELVRLGPRWAGQSEEDLYETLRDEMWEHFRDSITGEHSQSFSEKRFKDDEYKDGYVPMGQEIFVNPDNAGRLLRKDWQDYWTEQRMGYV